MTDVKELVEALKPFALVAEHDIGESETDADLFRPMEGKYARASRLTVGDLRRARDALESLSRDRAGEQKVVADGVGVDARAWLEKEHYRYNAEGNHSMQRIIEHILGRLASQPLATQGVVTAPYTNWRGERAPRTFIPHRVFFGSNEWHPEPQVLIEGTDCVTGELRTFAAAGFASPAPDDVRRRPVKVDVTKDWCLRMAALEGDAEIGAGSIPPDDVRQMAVAWPKEVLEFEDFINEPPQYEELKNVRDYRHELYPKWQRVLTAIRSLATAPPAADPRDAVITDEMIDAGKEALRDHTSSYFDGHDEVGSGAVEAIIRAALRASSEKEQKA